MAEPEGGRSRPNGVREPVPAYVARAPKVERSPLLDEVIARVVEAADPDRIILFGSTARSEAGPDSDIDLLVIKSDVESRLDLEGAIHMNLFGIDASVDVMVVTPEDVERLKDGVGTVIGPAIREGIEVYAAPTA